MITKKKYLAARKIVRNARVSTGVKELMYCALRQYSKDTTPITGTYQALDFGTKKACLVGAAIANRMRGEFVTPGDGWDVHAAKEFGIREDTIGGIIGGFDDPQYVAHNESRAKKLAANISRFLELHTQDE
jgi:hypothetical protein